MTVGPTGSGKSGLMNEAIKYIHHPGKYEIFLIDDLVENDPVYKQKANEILAELEGNLKILYDPPEKLYKKFGDAYFSVRKDEGCGMAGKGGCSAQFDQELRAAIDQGKNIVFETTGQYYPKWLVEMTQGKYDVVLAYTLVSLCSLLDRNKSRAYDSAVAYLANPEKAPAPRLPNVSPTGPYRKSVENVKNVFFEIIARDCLNLSQTDDPKNDEFCSPYDIENILLFDNNTRPMKLVADVTKDKPVGSEALEHVFRTYMATPPMCPAPPRAS